MRQALYVAGDYAVAAAIGTLTAVSTALLVWDGLPMSLSMLIGMGAGMVVHLFVGLAAAVVVGLFEVMMPGMVIGMLGGMVFGMIDSHVPMSWGQIAMMGTATGLAVAGVFHAYDRVLTGQRPL